ncbi:MAG: hypothetical protein KDA60_10685 [Planctomycetales bacterium]|nr:hypothetical protein [Planctomycetales bacterium]
MSQSYLLNCTCGKQTVVRPTQAGGKVACLCGQSLSVPKLRELRQLPSAVETEGPSDLRSWSMGRGIVFSSGVLVSLLAVGAIGYLGWLRKDMDVSRPKLEEVFTMDSIESWTPAQTYQVWAGIRDAPLVRFYEPRYLVDRARLKKNTQWLSLAGGLFVIGVGMCAGALARSRRSMSG